MLRCVLICLGLSLACDVAWAKPMPSFLIDVMPIFTRHGCNQGSCHGKNAGQNGFRLSLRGYAPETDYTYLTREFAGRRVNLAVPDASLLLQKPTGIAPHEGGKLFSTESRAYQLLRQWIVAGAPGPRKEDPGVVRLEIEPAARTMKVGERQQLKVKAHYSDGMERDVTWLAKFDSNDPGMVTVDADGMVRILRQGETALRVSYQGLVAVALVTAPFDAIIPADRFAARNNVIDDCVFNKLQALRIPPSGLCDDSTFLRRVFLDGMGTVPTPDEVRAFFADTSADKRAKLIDGMLERPEFVDYWTLQWSDLFQNRKERDHDVRGTKGVRSFHAWLRTQVAANRRWDQLVRDVLTATGTTAEQPAVGYFIVTVGEHREAEKSEVAASVAQALLGTRIGCAQCHNHPLENYTQDDYYHFAGFFSRIKFERKESKDGPTRLSVAHPDPNQDKNPVGVVQPRTGKFLPAQPLDRSATAIKPGEDPRIELAKWITDPKNEYFSGAMVNRLWKHFLGVGMVEPVDDLRASNPPSNPELWKALNAEFVRHGFDVKHVMRLIMNSRTYQLSSATVPENVADGRSYSHYYVRRLPAEVLLDAFAQSTGLPEQFPGYPIGLRAIQLPDPGLKSYFLSLFGRSERVTACACERNGEVTMPQLLHLQNGDDILRRVQSPEGRLGKLLQAKVSDDGMVEELFLATLSRKPTEAEVNRVKQSLAQDGDRADVFRDLFWALLNAKEFAFTH